MLLLLRYALVSQGRVDRMLNVEILNRYLPAYHPSYRRRYRDARGG